MERLEQILDELFRFEPELKAHEAEVRHAVSALLASRPDVKIDPAFATSLKQRLLSGAPQAAAPMAGFSLRAALSWVSRPTFAYGLAGLLVVVLAAGSFYAGQKRGEQVAVYGGSGQQNGNGQSSNSTASSNISVAELQKPEVADVKKFASKEEFLAYLSEAQNTTVGYGRGGGPVALEAPMANSEMGMAQKSMSAPISDGAADRVSQTNVQVQGVDEPDIVKTDGQNLFVSVNQPYYGYYQEKSIDMPLIGSIPIRPQPDVSTKVVGALPASDMKLLSKIPKQGDMLLNNNVLMVFDYQGVWAYDVKDKSNPKELWKIKYEQNGQLSAARLYNGKLYLVVQNYADYSNPCPVRPLTVGKTTIEIPCRDIYHPVAPVSDAATYHAFAIDTNSGEVKDKLSFVGSAGTAVVYMSQDNLYVTYTYSADQIKLTVDFLKTKGAGLLPGEVVARLEKLDSYDIGGNAKMVEMQNIIQKYMGSISADDQRQKQNDLANRMTDYLKENKRKLFFTGIAKIGLGNFDILATGKVPGQLLNQFALDEYQGSLRLAVTVGGQGGGMWGGWNNQDSANDVYVLDKNLNQTGSVQDLGLTERIYSARFINDKAYLVTFRQTDPFYVLDLSNPKNPQLKGELKIPGYSSYLHPLADNIILGVGQENGKVKLSLFDVSDAANPKEIDKYSLDEYWTEAANNHHAFLQDEQNQVFFLPGGQSGYVFSYAGNQLNMKRAITGLTAKRAVYIGNSLYVVGESKIVVVDEKSWERIGELDF